MSPLAALPTLPAADLPARLAALRWSDFRLDLAHCLPRGGWSSRNLYSDPRCEINLFFIPRGHQIPLHDHPHMHVWMRVLCGQLQTTSYTWQQRPLALRSGDALLDPGSPVWAVSPERDNLHMLRARTDVAFLDVLRPPYVGGRICTYYDASPAGPGLWHMHALASPPA